MRILEQVDGMMDSTIRRTEMGDIDGIMQIWKIENIRSHNFISSNYWEENYTAVKYALPNAEVYVFVCKGDIVGFVGLNGDYIEGIFVKADHQRKGIGQALLNTVKSIKSYLTLNVYKKNNNAVKFYLKNNFKIMDESIDDRTNECEYVMQWEK